MATATMVTAAGMAMLLYYVLSRRMAPKEAEEERIGGGGGDLSKPGRARRRRVARRPSQPPSTWREAVATLAGTLRFTYSETLGKWPIGDLAFGIKYLMRRQGNVHVASVYAGNNCVQLRGPDIMAELIYLLKLLNLCFLFSKKPFLVFLETAGYSQEDVLIHEPKAGLLKPAFTILRDENSKCFLLLVRGTHSIKDTLTAVTGAVVPFHHSLLDESGVSKLVLGYAHCGMVVAARWIAKCTIPCLRNAVSQFPDYKIKIVGHSLGGGTAALLTYILREHKEFFSTTCVAFAPGMYLKICYVYTASACMTWDLAESGKHFITTIINGTDLVPTFSTASIDDLRSEVTASSWLNDLKDQVQQTRFLNVVYRSVSSARDKVVMRQAQNVAQAVVRSRSTFSSWSCIGARRRSVGSVANSKEETTTETLTLLQHGTTEELVGELQFDISRVSDHEEIDIYRASDHEETEEEALLQESVVTTVSTTEEITEGELWLELEKELKQQEEANSQAREEQAAAAKEHIEEEAAAVLKAVDEKKSISADALEGQQLYPPGRIMHMVALPPADSDPNENIVINECDIGLYVTPRELYSKIRLSKTMINDHYMPMYRKMMELLIDKLAVEDDGRKDSQM
ncbi:Sn1-specific diacylglycerol lipase alpha [Ananas comosus]|uniref:Sn1-specific diacylglycerol lipase alpha n=1 Tax=Ananas comosus TaxID=4615 RepID=A0A199VJY1_ANACO|nr:Sn1-specific diacylglycerol lipase alpha [Ananas comosus]